MRLHKGLELILCELNSKPHHEPAFHVALRHNSVAIGIEREERVRDGLALFSEFSDQRFFNADGTALLGSVVPRPPLALRVGLRGLLVSP